MLGKQWVNRYLRRHGGSAAEKSRDRQRKLDGFNKWNFRLVIESFPVMLQLALLLLGCALSLYLWTTSRTVARVILAFTLSGVILYIFFTLAASLYYDCPYQTPTSILTRIIIRHLMQSDTPLARSLRPLISSLPSTKDLRRLLGCLLSGVRGGFGNLYSRPTVGEGTEGIPLAVVVAPPTRIFEDLPVNWEVYEGDSRCISWVLDYTTDPDVMFSSVQFATDMIWYPEIAGVVSPHILADRFFDCLLDGRVIPGRSEHARAIGMALASVLSASLIPQSKNFALEELCRRVHNSATESFSSTSSCFLIMKVLGIITNTAPDEGSKRMRGTSSLDSDIRLSTADKLWMGRMMLQTFWRYGSFHRNSCSYLRVLTSDGNNTPNILKTTCFLAVGIFLGLKVDSRDLHPPNTRCVVPSMASACSTHRVVAMRYRQLSIVSINSYKSQFGRGVPMNGICRWPLYPH